MKLLFTPTLFAIALSTSASGQASPPGSGGVESCRQSLALRDAENVFDPALGDVLTDDSFRAYTLGDVNADGAPDLLIVDYFMSPHYAAVACGASGDILYGLESVSPDGYWFAVEATTIGDADSDGVPDFMLVSHDGLLGVSDILILSGAGGGGIARIDAELVGPDEVRVTATLFADVNKSGTSNPQDVYIVVGSSTSTNPEPVADLNLDGVVDHLDVALAGSQSGPISASTIAVIAAALEGSHTGSEITLTNANLRLFGWLKKVLNCAACLIECGDSYGDAWDCGRLKRQAECDCYDLPIEDRWECVQDVHDNFLSECLSQAAQAAGDCGQCILDCHPLAP